MKLQFIKNIRISEPRQTLFQRQIGYVQHLTWKDLHTKRDKRRFYYGNLSKFKT